MSINRPYRSASELPTELPLFPLEGALLLPRGQLPLNIFEPRYMAMIDDALAGDRLVAMIQPAPGEVQVDVPALAGVGCVGRITQLAETGDGRYIVSLTGVTRFRLGAETGRAKPYRVATLDFSPYAGDFDEAKAEPEVDRAGIMRALREFAEANDLRIDWKGVENAATESLVNALSMMSPFGPKEKQALLEAPDVKTRADVLIAITEMELARASRTQAPLQ